MRERVRRQLLALLVALLVVPMSIAQTTPEDADDRTDPALAASIRSTTEFTMDALDAISLPSGIGDCEERSVAILTERIFRFSEEGDERGCAYVFLPMFIPSGAETMRVEFAANRVKVPTLDQQATTQQFVQELRILDLDNNVLDDETIFGDTAGEQRTPQSFSFLLRFPEGTRDARLAWYFEDAQTAGGLVDGAATTPAWRSEVRAPSVSFDPLPVAFATRHLEDVVLDQEGIILHGTVVDVTLSTTDLMGGTHTLELDILESYSLQALTLPGSRNASLEELQIITTGGTTTLTVPDGLVQNPGTYSFLLQSTSPYVVMDAPPTTVYPLVWAGIFLPVGVGVGASIHHELFRRQRVKEQDADWYRMLVSLALLWIVYLAYLLLWAIDGGLGHMGALPVQARGTMYWAAAALAAVFFAVHWGMGSMRRRQAYRMRHEQELEARNVMLERSNKELEQFAFMAAHDLQEPLRKITSYTTLLQHRYKDKLDKKADGYIDQAASQADRMRALITDVLTFSRIDQDMEMQEMGLDELYQELQRSVPGDLRKTGVAFSGKDLGKAWGNPTMVRQLLENLVGNGIKYRRPGVKPRIQIATEDVGDAVRVEVTDNGIGIEPEYQDRVFDLFERLHGTDSQYKGTGIGLAICKKIVEAHGGRIGVESTPGRGSTFFFTLPHRGIQ